MANSNINKSEKYISKQFDKESKSFDKNDGKKLSSTAEQHVLKISKENKFEVALDIGSGTAGIISGFLENNVKFGCGIDLSPKMVDYANKRLEDKGFSSQSDIQTISFLDYEQDKKINAISIHRVLCCHPDRESMLEKTISLKPEMIVLTIPRTWLLFRGLFRVFTLIRKIKPGFSPYLHKIKDIDLQLQNANYKLVDTFQTKIWTTRTYIIQKAET